MKDGSPSDREINRREAGLERLGLAISVLFVRQCSGINGIPEGWKIETW